VVVSCVATTFEYDFNKKNKKMQVELERLPVPSVVFEQRESLYSACSASNTDEDTD